MDCEVGFSNNNDPSHPLRREFVEMRMEDGHARSRAEVDAYLFEERGVVKEARVDAFRFYEVVVTEVHVKSVW